MWHSGAGAGGMGGMHDKNNAWFKLMGIVHKERHRPTSTIFAAATAATTTALSLRNQ